MEIRAQRLAVVRVDAPTDEQASAPRRAEGHEARFGGRARPVVMGRGDDPEPGKGGHERLVLVDRLERPLTDLGLVRRVRGSELAAADELVDRGRDVMAVYARPEEGRQVHTVARRKAAQFGRQLDL